MEHKDIAESLPKTAAIMQQWLKLKKIESEFV